MNLQNQEPNFDLNTGINRVGSEMDSDFRATFVDDEPDDELIVGNEEQSGESELPSFRVTHIRF